MTFRNYKTGSLISSIIVLSVLLDYVFGLLKLENLFDPLPKVLKSTDILTVPFAITLIFIFIDKVAWKWKIFNWLIDVPNISGRFVGTYVSSLDNNKKSYSCAFEIKQSGSKIIIRLYYEMPDVYEEESQQGKRNEAFSVLEDIREENGRVEIKFLYSNYDVAQSRVEPLGGVNMRYNKENKTKKLTGYFFNKRPHVGLFELIFESKKCIGTLKP